MGGVQAATETLKRWEGPMVPEMVRALGRELERDWDYATRLGFIGSIEARHQDREAWQERLRGRMRELWLPGRGREVEDDS